MRLAHSVIGIAGYVLAALSVLSLGLGAWLAQNTLSFHDDRREALGEVVGYRESQAADGKRTYTPRVAFIDFTGQEREFLGQLTTTTRRFAAGSRLPVQYRATDPQQARIALFLDNWLGATVAFVLGVLCALAAVLLVRTARRELA
jgi:hypothetical protein